MLPDSGLGEAPDKTDLEGILTDGYPASSARVVAALARRCRELQEALVEATGELERAQLSIAGLSQSQSQILELSKASDCNKIVSRCPTLLQICIRSERMKSPQVRTELNEERQRSSLLQNTVAKLRNIVVAQARADGTAGKERYNPYIAAWYRKANADGEFQQYPPKVSEGGGSR